MVNEVIVPEILNNKNLTIKSGIVKQERRKYLDKSEIQEKLSNITDPNDKFFCTFLWMSGIRVSEAINIKKKDISSREKFMIVKWLKSRKYFERIVPLHPQLNQMLDIYTAGMNMDDRIFPFSRQNAFYITKKWLGVSPHKLRHSFAVNWLREGGDIAYLSKALGHRFINTTGEYLKIVPSDVAKELEKIRF
ncbi:MAG TPA: site-specific integrase [Bacilli bacterium]|nr:site-specific integrase [Bacilli bacterium]